MTDRLFSSLPGLPQSSNKTTYWPVLPMSANALGIANLLAPELAAQPRAVILLVTESVASANDYYHALDYFLRSGEAGSSAVNLCLFPDYETLPYDVFSPSQELISERLSILQQLAFHESKAASPILIIASVTSLLQRLPPKSFILSNSLDLKIKDCFNSSKLASIFVDAGYVSVATVREHGQFCVRGALLDLFPMGSKQPIRLDFLDDELDSLRLFDPETQLTTSKVKSVNLLPAHEFILDSMTISRFQASWDTLFKGSFYKSDSYQLISKGRSFAGIEYYLPLLHEQTMDMFDYLPENALLIQTQQVAGGIEALWKKIQGRYNDYSVTTWGPLLQPEQVFIPFDDWFGKCKRFKRMQLNSERSKVQSGIQPLPDIQVRQGSSPYEALQKLMLNTQKVLFCVANSGRQELLLNMLAPSGIKPVVIDNWDAFISPEVLSKPVLTLAPLAQGFICQNLSIAVITEAELLGNATHLARFLPTEVARQRTATAITNLMELREGDALVHLDHGIGLYRGLQSLNLDDRDQEFVALEYADNDKLYVPITSLHLLSRYSSQQTDADLVLHKLGKNAWKKARDKAVAAIRDSAAELLQLYATRESKKGTIQNSPEKDFQQFSSEFAFEETSDQLKAINAIREDMAKTCPMDRLVCGDVGFGKTEVAMRAAFISVMSNKQVLVLVPTTVLANQHYETFLERFSHWPVTIDLLSRLRIGADEKSTFKQFNEGFIDILIGTHKLLYGGLNLDNLGLFIIDEEHRFGVRQKEKLKSMRTQVDILALTATPIPRTLNMALSALRDMSIIAEPPARRLAVKTFICEYDLAVIKEAIQREVLRGGQVFFLHNEIRTIERTARTLAELTPDAKVSVGHGQMPRRGLEQVMFDFHRLRYNVLVCSTIIETGIDIPNANTIIIERADKFGLAQLHQLRGRVGRSHHQAYAYLLTPGQSILSTDAKKRFQAIEESSYLGSGFTLATQDLEIRGSGEILGENQSGQIHAIGLDLYRDLLNKAVSDLLKGKSDLALTEPVVEVNLNISALIPQQYLADVNLRLSLYRQIASATSKKKLNLIKLEMTDRFGRLPKEVIHLFEIAKLGQTARALRVSKVTCNSVCCKIMFAQDVKIDPIHLVKLIDQYPQSFHLKGASMLLFTGNEHYSMNTGAQERIKAVQWLFSRLQGRGDLN